jgi:EAL domain-containing protein (putative c-di-GMP-specific phosphodiesterase class I)
VAVNVSGRQLQDDAFPGDVAAALAASGLAPERLVLEVTETSLVRDPRHARRVLGELRALGVRTALDDFGTGFSSLAYLQELPLDVLKIDQKFVRDAGHGPGPGVAFARAIVSLGAALGLHTVAEGIETPGQRDALAGMGCDLGQGYLFARPLDLAALDSCSPRVPRRSAPSAETSAESPARGARLAGRVQGDSSSGWPASAFKAEANGTDRDMGNSVDRRHG